MLFSHHQPNSDYTHNPPQYATIRHNIPHKSMTPPLFSSSFVPHFVRFPSYVTLMHSLYIYPSYIHHISYHNDQLLCITLINNSYVRPFRSFHALISYLITYHHVDLSFRNRILSIYYQFKYSSFMTDPYIMPSYVPLFVRQQSDICSPISLSNLHKVPLIYYPYVIHILFRVMFISNTIHIYKPFIIYSYTSHSYHTAIHYSQAISYPISCISIQNPSYYTYILTSHSILIYRSHPSSSSSFHIHISHTYPL